MYPVCLPHFGQYAKVSGQWWNSYWFSVIRKRCVYVQIGTDVGERLCALPLSFTILVGQHGDCFCWLNCERNQLAVGKEQCQPKPHQISNRVDIFFTAQMCSHCTSHHQRQS